MKKLTILAVIALVFISTVTAFADTADSCACHSGNTTVITHHRHTTPLASTTVVNVHVTDSAKISVQQPVAPASDNTPIAKPAVAPVSDTSNSGNNAGLYIIGIVALVVVIGVVALMNNSTFRHRNDNTVAIIDAIHSNGGEFSDGSGRRLRVNAPTAHTVSLRSL